MSRVVREKFFFLFFMLGISCLRDFSLAYHLENALTCSLLVLFSLKRRKLVKYAIHHRNS